MMVIMCTCWFSYMYDLKMVDKISHSGIRNIFLNLEQNGGNLKPIYQIKAMILQNTL
jgi:hypothetical protein